MLGKGHAIANQQSCEKHHAGNGRYAHTDQIRHSHRRRLRIALDDAPGNSVQPIGTNDIKDRANRRQPQIDILRWVEVVVVRGKYDPYPPPE